MTHNTFILKLKVDLIFYALKYLPERPLGNPAGKFVGCPGLVGPRDMTDEVRPPWDMFCCSGCMRLVGAGLGVALKISI